MKILGTIHNDFAFSSNGKDEKSEAAYRQAAKGIIVNSRGEIALTHRTHGYSLPGGGIEAGENPEEALIREIKEEVGFSIDEITPLGIIYEIYLIEGKDWPQKVFSFYAKEKENLNSRSLTESEAGMEIVWMPIKKAYEEFLNSPPSIARTRALLMITEAQKII